MRIITYIPLFIISLPMVLAGLLVLLTTFILVGLLLLILFGGMAAVVIAVMLLAMVVIATVSPFYMPLVIRQKFDEWLKMSKGMERKSEEKSEEKVPVHESR